MNQVIATVSNLFLLIFVNTILFWEKYEFLGIDIRGQSLGEVFNDLKSGKMNNELEYKHYRAVNGNKSQVRDAAFKLLRLILLSDFEDERKDSAKVFNAVLFVMPHSSTFKGRTRRVVRAANEERFVPSVKQRATLDQWAKADGAEWVAEQDGDATTEEEESDHYFDLA